MRTSGKSGEVGNVTRGRRCVRGVCLTSYEHQPEHRLHSLRAMLRRKSEPRSDNAYKSAMFTISTAVRPLSPGCRLIADPTNGDVFGCRQTPPRRLGLVCNERGKGQRRWIIKADAICFVSPVWLG